MRSSVRELLASQGLGVACGLATIALLAVGSVVMAASGNAPDLDDLGPFLREPSILHAWFYLLVPVLALYALNLVLCTWDQAVGLVQRRRWALALWAPVVIHLAFPVALLAHGIGGLWGRELGVTGVGPEWTALPDGREARVRSLVQEFHPDDTERQSHATVEIRGPDGIAVEELSFNGPESRGWGADLLFLLRAQRVPAGARLARSGERCDLAPGGDCTLGGATVRLVRLRPVGEGEAWAVVRVQAASGTTDVVLAPGGERSVGGGAPLRLEEVLNAPMIVVRARHAPGTPWALASAVPLVLGLLMMGRRWKG